MPDPFPDATLFRPGENCSAVARAARAKVLVDGEAYYDAFVRAAERAERSIVVLAWDFDSRMCPRMGEDGKPDGSLGEFLNELARRKRQLRIRILDWDYPMIFGAEREIPPIYGIAGWKPHRHIEFRYDDTHPLAGSHHQKLVVIDDRIAFAGGQDLACKRWDTPEHAPGDPRRRLDGKPYPPQHDVMVLVDGEAATALAQLARRRWKTATGRELPPVQVDHDPWPAALHPDFRDVTVAVSCTLPECGEESAVRHVEQLYLDMIERARHSLYIENQYFTSKCVGEALARRLADPGCPEIVVVTRLLSHGWLEEMTMQVLRTRLVRDLRTADVHGKFSVFHAHVEGLDEGTCLDVHSKVMIVDDDWLRIGSSNLSNRSMGLDSECDLTIEAGGSEAARAGIRRIRDRLIAEHLGQPIAAVARKVEEAGSMAAAIRALGSQRRCLVPVRAVDLPEEVIDMAAIGDLEKPISMEALVESLSPITAAERAPRGGRILLLASLAAAVVLALAWRHTPLAEVVTAERAVAWAQSIDAHWWAPWLVMLAYTPASVLMFPRPLITLAAVVAFGPWEGATLALSGIVLSAIAGYGAGRLSRRATVRRLAGRRVNRLSRFLRHKGLVAMTLVRLVPIAPFQVVNVVAGAMRIRLRDFVAGTALGVLPGLLAATLLGDQIVAALADDARLDLWLIAGVVAALGGVAYAGHRWFRRVER